MADELPIPTRPESDGWDWFEKQQTETKTLVEQRLGFTIDEITGAFQRVFNSKDGQIVLAYMDVFANDVRDFDPSLGFYNGAAFGFYRSGQKSYFAMIRAFLNRKPKQSKGPKK